MLSGIYCIKNIITNKVYVGSTKNFKKRWNTHLKDLQAGKHSSIKLQRSYNKHGEDKFVFEIIELVEYDKDVIVDKENYYINHFDSKANGYNIADAAFGDALTHHPNRLQIIENIRNANIKRMQDPEERIKSSQPGEKNGMYGKTHTEEARKRISEAQTGRESYRKGKTFEEAHGEEKALEMKAVISKHAKERIGDKNSFYGKKHSEESKKKISESNKGKIPPNRKAVIVDGIEYTDFGSASKATGIGASTIWHRIRSKNIKFIDTYYKDKPKKGL